MEGVACWFLLRPLWILTSNARANGVVPAELRATRRKLCGVRLGFDLCTSGRRSTQRDWARDFFASMLGVYAQNALLSFHAQYK